MGSETNGIEQTPEIPALLEQAREAYEADDSKAVADLCRQVTELDPDNAEAWDLLAKFGGWDSKLYHFDIDFAIESAEHALSLIPENQRYDAASEIYTARKRQIAKILESEMMMPSYTAAKQLHGTMMEWKRLLQETPYLSVSLLEGEVALCENLCLRSRVGIMPGDRLVYTAYASLNHKETYGETFRKALTARLQREQARQEEQTAAVLKQADERFAALEQTLADAQMDPAERKRLLEGELSTLNEEMAGIADQTNKAVYELQLQELEGQLAALKPLKIFKRQELSGQIAATKEKIAEVQASIDAAVAPLRAHAEAIQQLLGE